MKSNDQRGSLPNAETVAAMDEYYAMKAHPENYKRYPSFKNAVDEVLKDVSNKEH